MKRLAVIISGIALFLMLGLCTNKQVLATDASNFISAPKHIGVARKSNKSINVRWTTVTEADGYEIYRYNPTSKKYVKRYTVKKSSQTEWLDKGLLANKVYKYKIRTYKTENGTKVYSNFTNKVWAKTYKKKAKKINARAPKLSAKNVYLGLCSTKEIKSRVVASQYGKNKKKQPISKYIRWTSSDSEIATVNQKGVITAGSKLGVCYISAKAHNGAESKIKVTVKNYAKTNDYYNYGKWDDIYTLITDFRTEIQNIAEYYSVHRVKAGNPIKFDLNDEAELVVSPQNADVGSLRKDIEKLLVDFPYYISVEVYSDNVEFVLKKEDNDNSLPAYVTFFFDNNCNEWWNIQIASHWTAYRFQPV